VRARLRQQFFQLLQRLLQAADSSLIDAVNKYRNAGAFVEPRKGDR
jgi:hypothetical protein